MNIARENFDTILLNVSVLPARIEVLIVVEVASETVCLFLLMVSALL